MRTSHVFVLLCAFLCVATSLPWSIGIRTIAIASAGPQATAPLHPSSLSPASTIQRRRGGRACTVSRRECRNRIGIAVGGAFGLLILGVLFYFCVWRRRSVQKVVEEIREINQEPGIREAKPGHRPAKEFRPQKFGANFEIGSTHPQSKPGVTPVGKSNLQESAPKSTAMPVRESKRPKFGENFMIGSRTLKSKPGNTRAMEMSDRSTGPG